ncbi:MAG: hypothetical protein KatS3mg102_1654 [Planctomycetota bacterium]|nr:MAG: hypothetical protein KatS3mg102_1654 [Planctomycetota bacterium]
MRGRGGTVRAIAAVLLAAVLLLYVCAAPLAQHALPPEPAPPPARVLLRAAPVGASTSAEVLAARAAAQAEQPWRDLRLAMVREQIEARGLGTPPVLEAMRAVARHRFVPAELRAQAYEDRPLPIGHGQTISQPYIVAFMTEMLALQPGARALEVGTGSGYQAAVLAELAAEVVTIEIIGALAHSAAERLQRLGYRNVTVVHGDGYFGWPERAPYDAIVVTAAATHIPPPLLAQLRPGGRMAIPLGDTPWTQSLVLVRKAEDGTVTARDVLPVAFVPFTRQLR